MARKLLVLVLNLLLVTSAWAGTAIDYNDANCQGAWLMDVDEDPITDSSGNGRTGALFSAGNPDFATASPPAVYSTGYYDFSSDYIDVAVAGGVYSAYTSGSVVAWANPASGSSGVVWASSTDSGTNRQFVIAVEDQTGGLFEVNMTAVNPGGSIIVVTNSDNTFSYGSWFHFAYTSGSGDGFFICYVNGVSEAFTAGIGANTDVFFNDTMSSNDDFQMGAKSDSGNPHTVIFDGPIDEVAIFNDVLNSTETNDIMDNGLAPVVITATTIYGAILQGATIN